MGIETWFARLKGSFRADWRKGEKRDGCGGIGDIRDKARYTYIVGCGFWTRLGTFFSLTFAFHLSHSSGFERGRLSCYSPMLAQVGRHLDRGYIQVISRLRSTVTACWTNTSRHFAQFALHSAGRALRGKTRRSQGRPDAPRSRPATEGKRLRTERKELRHWTLERVDLGCVDSPPKGPEVVVTLSWFLANNRGGILPSWNADSVYGVLTFPLSSFPFLSRLGSELGQHSVSSSAIDGCDGGGDGSGRVRAYT